MFCRIRGSSEIKLSVEGTNQFLGFLPRSDELCNHSIPTNQSAPRPNYQCTINLCNMDQVKVINHQPSQQLDYELLLGLT